MHNNNNHMFYAGPLPIYGCSCPACMSYRKQNATVGDYEIPVTIDWAYLWNKYSTPYSVAKEESVPTEKAIGKDFSGIYRFNYSTVDEFGFGSEHSIVLNVPSVLLPEDSFHEFVRLISSEIRYHLIEYFLVRWENGEYVKV